MQFHCVSQHCSSSPCHCHQCYSEPFVAVAALFEPLLSYAVPSLRFALSSRSRAIHCISFAILFFTVLLKAIPSRPKSTRCPCAAFPCISLPLLLSSSLCYSFAFPVISNRLLCKPTRIFAIAHQFSAYLFHCIIPCRSFPLSLLASCCLHVTPHISHAMPRVLRRICRDRSALY